MVERILEMTGGNWSKECFEMDFIRLRSGIVSMEIPQLGDRTCCLVTFFNCERAI